jgi:uncharacterized protein
MGAVRFADYFETSAFPAGQTTAEAWVRAESEAALNGAETIVARMTERPMNPMPARLAVDEFVEGHLHREVRGEIDAVLAAFADDVIFNVVNAPGGPMVGIEAVRRGHEMWWSVARYERFTSVRRLHSEDLLADEGMWHGRFVGALFGPARPDLTVRYRVLHVLELRADRIVRETVWHDLAAIQRQLAGEERSS